MSVVNGGADAFRNLASRSRRFAGGDHIVTAVEAAIVDEVPALENGVRTEAMRIIPGRGGLNRLVAAGRFTTNTTRRRTEVSVKIRALPTREIRDPAAVNRGRLLHPTYGHNPRVVQPIRPGYFTIPMVRGSRMIRRQIQQALIDATRRF